MEPLLQDSYLVKPVCQAMQTAALWMHSEQLNKDTAERLQPELCFQTFPAPEELPSATPPPLTISQEPLPQHRQLTIDLK